MSSSAWTSNTLYHLNFRLDSLRVCYDYLSFPSICLLSNIRRTAALQVVPYVLVHPAYPTFIYLVTLRPVRCTCEIHDYDGDKQNSVWLCSTYVASYMSIQQSERLKLRWLPTYACASVAGGSSAIVLICVFFPASRSLYCIPALQRVLMTDRYVSRVLPGLQALLFTCVSQRYHEHRQALLFRFCQTHFCSVP